MHFVKAVIAACIVTLSPVVHGHGESGHGQPKPFDPTAAVETAFGRSGNPKAAKRTIRILMNDQMRVAAAGGHKADGAPGAKPHAAPGDLVFRRGETVRFVVRNDGKVMHEMVIGTMKELREHAELMRKHPGMEHDEPYMAHVAPGKQGEIVWQFTKAGEFHYACLIPGHMEAGMIAKITVK